MAEAVAAAGAEVTLVAGPVQLPTPAGVRRIDVVSAAEMHAAVMEHVEVCDLFIACAAVADYRPGEVARQKIKKRHADLDLHLVRNADIVADVAARNPRPFTVGFAAETTDLLQHARSKLERKGLDLVIANDVSRADIGFDSDYNEVHVLSAEGESSLTRGTKTAIARVLVQEIGERLRRSKAHPEGTAPT